MTAASSIRRMLVATIGLACLIGVAPASALADSTLTYSNADSDTITWSATAGSNETLAISYRAGADGLVDTDDDLLRFSATGTITLAFRAMDRCAYAGAAPPQDVTTVECRYRALATDAPLTTLTARGSNGNDLITVDAQSMTFARIGTTSMDLAGGAGNDVITGGPGNDFMTGGEGNDLLLGRKGNDTMRGDSGNDALYGDDGDDTLFDIFGGEDLLRGDAGDDRLIVQVDGQRDTYRGMAGNDSLTFSDSFDAVRMHLGEVRDANTDEDLADATIETLIGTRFDDVLSADVDADAETLVGADGNDVLISDGARTIIYPGRGVDSFQSRNPGIVTVSYFHDAGPISMNGSTVTVLEGTEILDDEHTRVIGSSFDDVLVGRAGIVDKLWGGDGDDTIDLRDGIADEMSDCGDGNDTIRLDVGVDAGPVACELINPIPPLDDVRPPAADPADPADPVAPVAPVAPVDPGADDEMSAAPATPPVMQIRLFEPLTYAAVARRQLITARFPVQSAGVRTVVRIRAYPRQARQMGLRVPRGQRYMVIGSAVTTSTRAGNLVVRPRLTFRARQALARTARQRRTSPRRIALHLDIALQQNGKQSRVIRGFTLRR